jgi:hypothetical protein
LETVTALVVLALIGASVAAILTRGIPITRRLSDEASAYNIARGRLEEIKPIALSDPPFSTALSNPSSPVADIEDLYSDEGMDIPNSWILRGQGTTDVFERFQRETQVTWDIDASGDINAADSPGNICRVIVTVWWDANGDNDISKPGPPAVKIPDPSVTIETLKASY